MCGILGVLNATYNSKSRKFMENGAVVGQIRGMDSTGVAQQAYNGVINVHKTALIGTYFAGDKVADKMFSEACNSRYTFLHHRAATQGKINVANAHPFVVQRLDEEVGKETRVVGVHNGSLLNWKNRDNGKSFEVDSEWALSRIADIGDDAFTEIEGPFAFVWGDTKHKDKVFMCRNSGRPLSIVFTKDDRQAYFASEAGMLAWLVERNEIDVKPEILSLEPGTIYEFDMSGQTIKVSSRKAPAVIPLVVHTPVVQKKKDIEPKHVGRAPDVITVNRAVYSNKPGAAQTAFIERLKAAMRSEDKKVEEAEEIVEQRTDDAPVQTFDGDEVPTKWFNDRSASTAEKEAAKQAGIFRELNWLEGVVWDDDTGDLMGDVKIFTPGKGSSTYVGILRGISQPRAHADFIANGNAAKGTVAGDWVVVIGLRSDPVCGNVVIVTELTQEGRRELEAQRAH